MKRFSFARRTPNHLIGIGIALLTLLLGGAFFSFIVVTRSAPKTDGTEEVRGIGSEVALHRNEYGIVHVVAGSNADAFFGIGYAHAQDRLWQMDFQRRVGRGQLSAIFGRATLEHDIFLRAMRFDSLAARLYRQTAPEARAALEAYTRGINAYMEANKGRLAFEFDALDYEPDAWKPEDCLLLQRLWAWEMSSAFTLDLTLSAVADAIGQDRARALLAPFTDNDPYYAPCVLDSALPLKPASTKNRLQSAPILDSLQQFTGASVSTGSISKLVESINNLRHLAQMHGSSVGSNAWATRPSSFFHQETDTVRDTTTVQMLIAPRVLPERYRHGALIANDLHTPFTTPTRFYEAHLTSPTLNVVGFMLPGMPFVLSGRNDKCAWAIANMMLDDTDYFAETLDSTDLKQIITPSGAKERLFFITDTVYVKDSSTAVVDVRYTKRSCVISDLPTVQSGLLRGVSLRTGGILTTLQDSIEQYPHTRLQTLLKRQVAEKRCITYSWTGQAMTDDATAWLKLNTAQSLTDARAAVQTLGAPAINLTLADTEGNVQVLACGLVPERLERFPFAGKTHPNFLRRGADTTDAWQGLLNMASDAALSLTNPPSGRVIAANNRLQRNSPNARHYSLLWDAPSRAARIGEYLHDFEHLSARNMAIMQTDVVSHTAQMLVPTIVQELSVTTNIARMRFSERQALKLLASWKYDMDARSAAASIYTVFLERYTYNTLADNLGEHLYRQYAAITRLPMRTMVHFTQTYNPTDTAATWFDNTSTSRIESRADVVRQSFSETIDYLLQRMNTDSVAAWEYGKLHTLRLRHTFSEQVSSSVPQNLKNAVESGKYTLFGDATTLFGSEWSFNGVGADRFTPVLGSTSRFVCDMQDTLVFVSCVGGNSGEIFTKAASNQLPLWLNNVMIPLSMSREAGNSFTQRLLLIPKS